MGDFDAEPIEEDAFWRQVRLNVTSWLIVCGVAGIGYIGYTVPRQLDMILKNQESQQEDIRSLAAQQKSFESRLIRLESRAR